ncbi:MAG: hypothetical protein WCK32_06610 [Chlorobiaceae bacterium]
MPVQPVDVGIITVKEEEFAAVLRHFPSDPKLHRTKEFRDYDISTIQTPSGTNLVAITRCISQGTGQAQLTASALIEDIAPRFIIVVGIAGAIPTPDFTLGDVIVSTFIHDLSVEDTGTGDPLYSASGGPLHREASRIVSRLPALELQMENWQNRIDSDRPPFDGTHTTDIQAWNQKIDEAFAFHREAKRPQPITRAEQIGSSDRLVKDPCLIIAWRKVIKGLVAVEMELAGVYQACQSKGVPCFAIRSISDVIGWRRDEHWTLYACEVAAAYAEALLKTGVFSGRTWSTEEFFIVTNLATRLAIMQLGGANLVMSVGEAEKLAKFVNARYPEKASDLMNRVLLLPSLENIGEKFALLSNWSESFLESFSEPRERCVFAVGLALARADALFQIACQNLPMAEHLLKKINSLMEPKGLISSLIIVGVSESAARKIAQPFFEFQTDGNFSHFRSACAVGVETILSEMDSGLHS